MKRCPYCAEEVQDAAILCKWCRRSLAPSPGQTALEYSYSGSRYLLGFGTDFFGIWDRAVPAAPVRTFPRTDDGWQAAWLLFVSWEPVHAEVGLSQGP